MILKLSRKNWAMNSQRDINGDSVTKELGHASLKGKDLSPSLFSNVEAILKELCEEF
jgi:hypothetical protein